MLAVPGSGDGEQGWMEIRNTASKTNCGQFTEGQITWLIKQQSKQRSISHIANTSIFIGWLLSQELGAEPNLHIIFPFVNWPPSRTSLLSDVVELRLLVSFHMTCVHWVLPVSGQLVGPLATWEGAKDPFSANANCNLSNQWLFWATNHYITTLVVRGYIWSQCYLPDSFNKKNVKASSMILSDVDLHVSSQPQKQYSVVFQLKCATAQQNTKHFLVTSITGARRDECGWVFIVRLQ